jgi:twitching motility protein PilJ
MKQYINPMSYKKWLIFLRTLMIVLAFCTFANFWYVNKQRDYDEQYLMHANELRIRSQRIAKLAEVAMTGSSIAFEQLKQNTDNYVKNINSLKFDSQDEDNNVLPASPVEIQTNELSKLNTAWEQYRANAEIILKKQQDIIKSFTLAKTYSKSLDDVEKNLIAIMLAIDKKEADNSYDAVKTITEKVKTAETIKENLLDVLNVNSSNPLDEALPKKVDNLAKEINLFEKENKNDQISNFFSEVAKNLQLVKMDADNVVKIGKILDEVLAAKIYIYNNSIPMLDLATALESSYRHYAAHRPINELTAYLLSFLTFLVMMVWLYLVYKDNTQILWVSEDKNKKLQSEIQKLLEELTGLAKGDLTVHIDAKDGVTKEIAQAINYSVNALREVVSNINKTTQETSKVAEEAAKIAKELAVSGEQQAQEIAKTTDAVHSMVSSIEKVSFNASKSEAVALESVKIASKGGEVVRNTISGMERIRLQIVDTSEKIRLLSESSQEIGEIVSLIEGIAEQTNILSLNAAIQAATAGEAGKRFAVVADEVQQLAGKASYATKEIASLVKCIQTDIQHVMVAMEQTRSEVVHGVTLAQDAGKALESIEAVSKNLSQLIQNISISAKEQASVSNNISTMMNIIKEITSKTTVGTVNTAQYIATLTQLITDLRHSVSEFKLPKGEHEPG